MGYYNSKGDYSIVAQAGEPPEKRRRGADLPTSDQIAAGAVPSQNDLWMQPAGKQWCCVPGCGWKPKSMFTRAQLSRISTSRKCSDCTIGQQPKKIKARIADKPFS